MNEQAAEHIREKCRWAAGVWRQRADAMDAMGVAHDDLTGQSADELRRAAAVVETWPDALTPRERRPLRRRISAAVGGRVRLGMRGRS